MRWLAGAAAATSAVVALGAAAHLPAVRGVLAAGPTCPLGFGRTLSPAAKDAAIREVNASLRGTGPSPAQPSLGFALDRTARPEVLAWAARARARCRGGQPYELECAVREAAPLPGAAGTVTAGTLFFSFGGDGCLKRLLVTQQVADAKGATAQLRAHLSRLSAALGAPSDAAGDVEAGYLAAGALRQVRRTFRFADYLADIRATNMGRMGDYTVHQTYQSLRD